MRFSVVSCSGLELASLDVEPSRCAARDVLEALGGRAAAPHGRRAHCPHLLVGQRRIGSDMTFADVAELGTTLTLVMSPLRVVAAGTGGVVHIWSSACAEDCVATLSGHAAEVMSAAFSPDGQQLLTISSFEGKSQLWCVVSSQRLHSFAHSEHRSFLFSAVFCPEGSRILTASSDRTAKLWSTLSGDCIFTLAGHKNEVRSAAFSPDGRQVITASADATAKLWSASSSSCVHTFNRGRRLKHAVFSNDASKILTTSETEVALWSTVSRKCLCTVGSHCEPLQSAALSPTGEHIVTASAGSAAKIWCAESGELLRQLEAAASAVFSPDGRMVLTRMDASNEMPNDAKLWCTSTGECLLTLRGHRRSLNAAMFSPDGSQALTASADGTAMLWSLETGECLRNFVGQGAFFCANMG